MLCSDFKYFTCFAHFRMWEKNSERKAFTQGGNHYLPLPLFVLTVYAFLLTSFSRVLGRSTLLRRVWPSTSIWPLLSHPWGLFTCCLGLFLLEVLQQATHNRETTLTSRKTLKHGKLWKSYRSGKGDSKWSSFNETCQTRMNFWPFVS